MTKLCARGKAAAKRKFKVYPSAYANAYASKICAGKIKDPSGTKRKDWGPKKAKTGLLANTSVSPSVTAESGVDGKITYENKGVGLGISNKKFGNINISKSDRKESMEGFKDLETKSKNINYNKTFKINDSSSFNINLNKGQSSNNFGNKTKTKGGTLTFTKTFSSGGYNGKFIKHDSAGIELSNESLNSYYGDLLK